MNTAILHRALSISTVEGVYSRETCAQLITEAEAVGFTDAPITTRMGFVMAPEVRNNTRILFDDVPRARALWELLSPAIPQRIDARVAIGLNERFRVYRYQQGQRFYWHRDGAFNRDRDEGSMLSLLVYLNEGFEGGETEIDVETQLSVRPVTGMALLFRHHVRHQGAVVRSGIKYVLRTDVMYRTER